MTEQIERWAVVDKNDTVWSFQKTEGAAFRIADGSATLRVVHMVSDTEAAAVERVRAWMRDRGYFIDATTLDMLLEAFRDEINERAAEDYNEDR